MKPKAQRNRMPLAMIGLRLGVSAAFAALLALAVPVRARDGNQDQALETSGSIALVSDYRFRGISYSAGDAAVQGEIEVAHKSGVYIGSWGSSLEDDGSGFGSVEIDLYAGWSGSIATNVSSDFSVMYYHYPGASGDPGFATDSFEANFSLSMEGGAVVPTVGISHAWAQSALDGRSNTYIFVDTLFQLPGTPVTSTLHLGYTDGAYSISNDGNNFDWGIAASLQMTAELVLGVEYVGIDGPRIHNVSDDSLILKLEASF